jgi:hypothetical protein
MDQSLTAILKLKNTNNEPVSKNKFHKLPFSPHEARQTITTKKLFIITMFGTQLNFSAMELKPENIEIRNKIIQGINMAFEELVITKAKKNQDLVVADLQGNVRHVPAKEFLKDIPENKNL